MRIIAGNLKGRLIETPRGHRTHPMGDRIKGGLFNTLGDIEGLTILDAFGGSGALAFEALSRGAAHAHIIDSDAEAHKVIVTNVATLGLRSKVKVTHAPVGSWSEKNIDFKFDIVLADPPYDDVKPQLIQKVAHHVKDTGILVVSWPGKETLPEVDGFELVKEKSYGDAQLGYYKRALK